MLSFKKVYCFALVLALSLSAFVLPARAVTVDTSQKCELTVVSKHNDSPVAGLKYDIYRVADVTGNTPTFTLSEDFSKHQISTDNLDVDGWNNLAVTLKSYAIADGLTPVSSGTSDSEGNIVFSDLPCALYLVVGNYASIGGYNYSISPFLVCLPYRTDASQPWQYTGVTAEPKLSASPIYNPPPDTPQTVVVTTRVRVLKLWEDKGYENLRPQKVTINLYCDGDLYDTVELNERNSWRHTWTELPVNHEYVVTEVADTSSYSVKLDKYDNTFTITNTYIPPETPPVDTPPEETPPVPDTPTPPPERLPQTGLFWWPVAVLAVSGIVFVFLGVAVSRVKRYDE